MLDCSWERLRGMFEEGMGGGDGWWYRLGFRLFAVSGRGWRRGVGRDRGGSSLKTGWKIWIARIDMDGVVRVLCV